MAEIKELEKSKKTDEEKREEAAIMQQAEELINKGDYQEALTYLDKIVKHLVQEKIHKQKYVQDMIQKKKADDDARIVEEQKNHQDAESKRIAEEFVINK